jgi:hypothetical protein
LGRSIQRGSARGWHDLRIREFSVPVDIDAELTSFEWGKHARFYPGKIHACSPFRDEETPSFVVFLDKGNWVDRGFAREGYERGNFLTLLAYLRGSDVPNTELYLIRKYLAVDPNVLTLSLKLTLAPPPYPILDPSMLDNLGASEYLAFRGISKATQARYRVGYHAFSKAVALPWFDTKGNLVNVKFRSTTRKKFWCPEGGQEIRYHLFGWRHSLEAETLHITEAEIDALYLASNEFDAVALGTSHMSPEQERLLLQHPAKRLVICTDNDAAGEKAAQDISKRLGGYKSICRFLFPKKCKDVNDVKPLKVHTQTMGFLNGANI